MHRLNFCFFLFLGVAQVWAQGPQTGDTRPAAVSVPREGLPHEHGPMKSRGAIPGQIEVDTRVFPSSNWSGYAVIGLNFTEAHGSWVVPSVNCAGEANSSVSFWVGLDGWNTNTVEQTGTDSDCDETTPNYYAWYEFYPRVGVTITSVPIQPGDRMSATVSYEGSHFVVTMTNETTGASYSTSSTVAGALRQSAEWITELNGSYGLANFGTVDFGDDYTQVIESNYAADGTTSGPIAAFEKNVQEAIMVSDTNVFEAVPSKVSEDGTSFSVTWLAK